MTDSYGLMFKSSDDRVILDSEFARLVVLYKGRYVGTEEDGNSSSTYFPSPITTQEQPLVFIRPDSAAGIIGMSNLEIFGSPGNWTGFRVRIFNMYTIKPVGRWFVASFTAQALAEYGARLRDASRKVIFDSGTPSALFVRSSNNWTYAGSGTTGQGVTITYFNSQFNMAEDEYMLINNLAMRAVTIASGTASRQVAAMWNYPNRILTLGMIAAQNAVVTGVTVMVGKIIQ
jgi:hypothetical protein